MDNLFLVAKEVSVLFALMAVGFGCRRRAILDDSSIKGAVNLLILVVTPCLIIHVFQRPFEAGKLHSLGIAFVLAVLAHCLAIMLARIFVRHRKKDTLVVLRSAAVFSNAGFMGIPLEQAVLGEEGVFFGIVYVVVFNFFMWSWGLWTMGGKARLRMMLLNPGTVGLALAMPLFFFSVELPEMIARPLEMVADLNTPLAMIIIGYYLAGAKFGPVIGDFSAWVAVAVRLIAFPALVIFALMPLSPWLDRMMMLAIVTAASAPVAAMVSMFAAKFNRDVDTSVAVVSATTLLSIITMPVIIALAMKLLG